MIVTHLRVAVDKRHRRENDVLFALSRDGQAIRKNFRGSESPAASAATLITHGVDELGPLRSSVE
jgi:hypothetical protein